MVTWNKFSDPFFTQGQSAKYIAKIIVPPRGKENTVNDDTLLMLSYFLIATQCLKENWDLII